MSTFSTCFLVIYLILLVSDAYDECSKNSQKCEKDNEHCIAQTAKLSYPDPDKGLASWAVSKSVDYACNSDAYCKWGSMWDVKCININIPKYFPAAWYNEDNKQCSVITVPIIINATVSCCNPNIENCTSVFNGIDEETSTYSTPNCISRPDISNVLESVIGCYATEEFMRYLKCNITDFSGKCPLFFFNNLQEYAKCACIELVYFGEKLGLTDSYQYFKELTEMIEGIFRNFRGKDAENCPEWIFSCNSEGEAQLDVYEIICSLTIYHDTDIQQLKIEIDEGVNTTISNQVEIYQNGTNVVRVLMYSEEEAYNAIGWLYLNATETTPDEIDSCTMTETIWNLNEVYGDYTAPTPAPTDNCLQLKYNIIIIIIIITFLIVFLI